MQTRQKLEQVKHSSVQHWQIVMHYKIYSIKPWKLKDLKANRLAWEQILELDVSSRGVDVCQLSQLEEWEKVLKPVPTPLLTKPSCQSAWENIVKGGQQARRKQLLVD